MAEDVLKIGSLWSGATGESVARAGENFGHDWTTF